MESNANRALVRFWPGLPGLLADPIVQCLVLIALTSAVFLAFPGIDPWFSSLFYRVGEGFYLSHLGPLVVLRAVGRGLAWSVGLGLIAGLLVKLAFPERRSLVPPRATLFILSTFAAGWGIVVNLIFKDHWGRPRPTATDLFGGEFPFVGVWRISDYCATNCSFVSGEASAGIWLLTVAVLVPAPWRSVAVKVLLALAFVLSLNRIAFGGHYLSDVLLAWWMTLAVMAVAWRALYENPPDALTDEKLEATLTAAGRALRRAFRRTA